MTPDPKRLATSINGAIDQQALTRLNAILRASQDRRCPTQPSVRADVRQFLDAGIAAVRFLPPRPPYDHKNSTLFWVENAKGQARTLLFVGGMFARLIVVPDGPAG
jgi:hypothetical protein